MKGRLLKDEALKIKEVRTASDAFDAICRISKKLGTPSRKDIKNIISQDIHIEFFENLFSNSFFKDSLFEIIKNNKNQIGASVEEIKKANLEEKQYLQTTLYLSSYVLTNIFHQLNKRDVTILKERIVYKLNGIKDDSHYTITDVCFTLYDSVFNFEYGYRKDVDGRYDFTHIFKCNEVSRCLVGIMMLIIPTVNVLQIKFKKISREKEELKLSVTRGLCEIYSISKKILGGIKYFCRKYSRSNNGDYIVHFTDFFFSNNERNILYIFNEVSSNFHIQKDRTFTDVFMQKINEASEIKNKISKYVKKNLKAFGNVNSDGNEWSNKILLVSSKLLSSLDEIKDSSDDKWKVDVSVYELLGWIESVHKILNKHDIEDGWEKIEDLITQENSKVEWKSTFWTPTEEIFISDDIEKKKGRAILNLIVEPMIGMMNTEGGTILVGLVENPEKIIREDVKRNLIIKNNFTFFDIGHEFAKKKKSLDDAKRQIQDLLFSHTAYTADKFNNLWSIEPVEIKNSNYVATIYKIDIKKSDKYIYKVKKEDGALWITLIKRADGRTIKIDPREYFEDT